MSVFLKRAPPGGARGAGGQNYLGQNNRGGSRVSFEHHLQLTKPLTSTFEMPSGFTVTYTSR